MLQYRQELCRARRRLERDRGQGRAVARRQRDGGDAEKVCAPDDCAEVAGVEDVVEEEDEGVARLGRAGVELGWVC